MKKCVFFFSSLIMLLILMSFRYENVVKVPDHLKVTEPTEVSYPKHETQIAVTMVAPPFLGSSYIAFKEALAFKESQGNYFSINTLGYIGKYQFGIGTLQLMGVHNSTHFLNNPA
ncbi:MAG: hypothetical protein WBM83_06945, partial [Flavobacteriaceae bacterium]